MARGLGLLAHSRTAQQQRHRQRRRFSRALEAQAASRARREEAEKDFQTEVHAVADEDHSDIFEPIFNAMSTAKRQRRPCWRRRGTAC